MHGSGNNIDLQVNLFPVQLKSMPVVGFLS